MKSQQIANDALTILINLSTDREVLEKLASDKDFMKTLLGRVTVCQSPTLLLLPSHLTRTFPTSLPALVNISSS